MDSSFFSLLGVMIISVKLVPTQLLTYLKYCTYGAGIWFDLSFNGFLERWIYIYGRIPNICTYILGDETRKDNTSSK